MRVMNNQERLASIRARQIIGAPVNFEPQMEQTAIASRWRDGPVDGPVDGDGGLGLFGFFDIENQR